MKTVSLSVSYRKRNQFFHWLDKPIAMILSDRNASVSTFVLSERQKDAVLLIDIDCHNFYTNQLHCYFSNKYYFISSKYNKQYEE